MVCFHHPTPIAEDDSGAVPLDDDALVAAAQSDMDAFAQLYRRYLNRVYRYLMIRCGDTQLAQDLTSQTFLAALEGIARYRGDGHVAAWLLTIASHKLADHIRRKQRQTSLPLEAACDLMSCEPALDQLVAGRLQLEQIKRMLRELLPERAQAVALRYFGDLRIAEIAQVMGKSDAAVKMLIQRGLRDLHERLAFWHTTVR